MNVNLTNSELIIVEYLSKNLNKKISREEISDLFEDGMNLRSVDVTITRLRKKLISNKLRG